MPNRYKITRAVTFIVFSLFVLSSVIMMASSGGKTGATTLSGTPGCTCHGAQAAGVNVVINGPDTLQVNQTASFSVSISGGPLSAAGVNIATDGGDLNIVDGALKKLGNELTHTSPGSPSANQVVFNFEYTAPGTEGTVTLAATGNSVNLSGSNSGDQWNHAPDKLLTVVTATGLEENLFSTPETYVLEQNYPNPFNPATNIRYEIQKSGFVTLEVFNVLGQKISTLISSPQQAGSYTVKFDANDLDSGTYIYRLTVNGNVQSKRMVLLK